MLLWCLWHVQIHRVQKSGLNTHPWGIPMFRDSLKEVWLPEGNVLKRSLQICALWLLSLNMNPSLSEKKTPKKQTD